jgi:DNA-binding NarL/FixJ family response regulator
MILSASLDAANLAKAREAVAAVWGTPTDAPSPRTRGKGPMVLRLLHVEDHAAFRGALKFLLNLRPGMRVVAECGSLAGCRALEGLGSVYVALLDLMMPDGAGLIALLRGANPEVKVLILSASVECGVHERVTEAGADGLLNKTTSLTGIVVEAGRLAGVGHA